MRRVASGLVIVSAAAVLAACGQPAAPEGGAAATTSAAATPAATPTAPVDPAKAALLAYSKTMSIDLAADNILVNCVCPALIHTPLWDRLADSLVPAVGKTREEVFQNLANQHLVIKRYGAVEEVSGLVAFLASERASFTTGSAYDVDGGFTKSIL